MGLLPDFEFVEIFHFAPTSSLAPDYDFAQVVPGEEELQGLVVLEHLFEGAVVEELGGTVLASGGQEEGFAVYDAVGDQGHSLGFFVGLEEGEQESARPQNPVKTIDGDLEQGRGEELESIPEEGSVEALVGVVQGFFEKKLGALGVRLIRDEVSVSEGFIEGADDVVRIEAVAECGEKVDITLAGSGEVEDSKTRPALDGREKLVKTVAVTGWRGRGQHSPED